MTPGSGAASAGAGAPSRDRGHRTSDKTFRIPDQRIDSLKERAIHPLTADRVPRAARAEERLVRRPPRASSSGSSARNGSGKSTLLKILASIYRADAGRVRMAGRVAPFIELGVGFNPELTARENVVLNGVLMGLSRREAQRRLDAVIDFAELHEFADLKLKNYSSGMMVRLAFAVMVQADADIMLIDEVLAVGDAAFAQKCMDVFHERRRRRQDDRARHPRHGDGPARCATARCCCTRASCEYIGEPEDTALRYYRLNFDGTEAPSAGAASPDELEAVLDLNVRLVEATLRDGRGAGRSRTSSRALPITSSSCVEAARELRRAGVRVPRRSTTTAS